MKNPVHCTFGIILLTTLVFPQIYSFTLPCIESERTITKTQSCRQQTQLHQVAYPVEEKKGSKEDEDSMQNSWTEVEGGFLPNIGHLKRKLMDKEKRKGLITRVTTMQEYRDVVALAKEDLVVVKFYSPWCRACKAVAPHYRQLANKFSKTGVKFVEVPVTPENSILCNGLGVPSVPFGHIYHREAGLVEERKLKKADFSVFRQVLDTYVKGECPLPEEEEEEEP